MLPDVLLKCIMLPLIITDRSGIMLIALFIPIDFLCFLFHW